MDEEIEYSSLQEYTEALLEKSKGVFSVFCEVFGEDRCDMEINTQFYNNCGTYCIDEHTITPDEWFRIKSIGKTNSVVSVTVYFPEVDISNEIDKHHTIKELYVRTEIKADGRMGNSPKMLRTRYTTEELLAGYKHSHTSKIRYDSDLYFTNCCLGNAPIRSTVVELIAECDLDRWNVYCLQLDQYVGIESLNGGPHIKMSEVGINIDNDTSFIYDWSKVNEYSGNLIDCWVLYKFLMTTPINFAVRDGVFIPRMSALECALRITEICKEVNSTRKYLIRGVLIGNKLYSTKKGGVGINGIMALEGKSLLTFKGEPKYLSIDRCEKESMELVEIVSPKFLNSVIEPILIYVNTLADGKQEKYGKISKIISLT